MGIWETLRMLMKELVIFGAVTCRKAHLWRNNRVVERGSHRLFHVLSTKTVESVPGGSTKRG